MEIHQSSFLSSDPRVSPPVLRGKRFGSYSSRGEVWESSVLTLFVFDRGDQDPLREVTGLKVSGLSPAICLQACCGLAEQGSVSGGLPGPFPSCGESVDRSEG